MEQLEKQDKTVRKLKKQLKVFAKKIGELEGISTCFCNNCQILILLSIPVVWQVCMQILWW